MPNTEVKPHPEAMPGEVFLTNVQPQDFEKIGWKTKRKGLVARRADGSPVPFYEEHDFRPVFVKVYEINENNDPLRHP